MPIYSLLFRNRWFAFAWVGLTLFSVAGFVGKDGGAAQIGQSVDQLKVQRETLGKDVESAPVVLAPALAADRPKPVFPRLEALPGSDADPRDPQVGEVFVNPATGQRFRAVRRGDMRAEPAGHEPAGVPDTVKGMVP